MPTLRRARLSDVTALAQVESAAWRNAYRGILPTRYLQTLTPRRLAAHWRRRIPRNTVWVAQLGTHVVGYSISGPCRDTDMEPGFAGEIYELYVHPRLQGHGLGTTLMAHTWGALAQQGHHWGVLWVLEDNRDARAFYERKGMVIDRKRRPYTIRGHRVMAVRYAQPLNPLDLGAVMRAQT